MANSWQSNAMKVDRQLTGALDHPPKKGKKVRPFVIAHGIRYPMLRDTDSKMWRVRKRTKDIKVDFSTSLLDFDEAKKWAHEKLSSQDTVKQRRRGGDATLQEVVDAYRAMPKRCSEDTTEANIQRFTKIVQEAWGKPPAKGETGAQRLARAREALAQTSSANLPSLWEDYAAKRQGGKLDLSTRTHLNRGINSALRMASSLFHEGLEVRYEKAGIKLDFAAIRSVPWLPVIPSKLPKLEQEDIDKLMEALPKLKETDRPMWRAIMIARYAGLRSREVSGAHRSWLIQNSAGAWCFEVRDRPEEGWWHKTGEDYTAPIMSLELVEDLKECPADGPLVPVDGSRDHFFRKTCNRWLRQFIPRPNKGMHRLRALYAETLAAATEKAVLAEQAGIEAAQKALGHTTSKTTTTSYLPAA